MKANKIFSIILILSIVSSCNDNIVEPNDQLKEQEIIDYTLTEINSIGVPFSHPVGIASDQVNFWILFGSYNANEHNLVYYNIDNYEVLKNFALFNLTEDHLGTGVYGITLENEYVWISVSGSTNKVVKVDTIDGSVIQTWASPGGGGPSDIEWDGEKLWIGTGIGQIYAMNIEHGGTKLFWSYSSIHDQYSRNCGLAIRGSEIWAGDLLSNDIYIFNKADSTNVMYLKDAIVENGNFCFHKDQLVVLDDSGIKFYEIQDK